MKHWSVDTSELEKNPDAFAIWKLEQAINWGLRDGKISKKELRAHWNKIDIDVHKRKLLSLVITE